jgi:hypothetical protein
MEEIVCGDATSKRFVNLEEPIGYPAHTGLIYLEEPIDYPAHTG